MSYDLLKVNILVSVGEAFHVDTLDLYSARVRAGFIKQAAMELNLEEEAIKKDIGKILLKLETLQDEQIKEALSPKKKEVKLTDEEREAALELLKTPNLLDRILQDFDACGVGGEETNKLTSYLAAVSRKLDRPLAVIIQSSSAAGKTALMDAVLSFIPEEEKAEYSAMTGQALFYMSGQDLSNKILENIGTTPIFLRQQREHDHRSEGNRGTSHFSKSSWLNYIAVSFRPHYVVNPRFLRYIPNHA